MASDAVVEAVGGAIGSAIALAATYPMLMVSTWQALESTANPAIRQKYASLPSPIKEFFVYSESGGWRTFFGGLQPNLVATAVSQAIYFYLYSKLRQGVVAYKRAAAGPRPAGRAGGGGDARSADIGVVGSMLVAGLAGCGNVLATSPVWVVATQMQALQRSGSAADRERTAWQVASQVHQQGGWRGFYKGLQPALAMVANPTLQYILYEWLTARLVELRQRGAATPKQRSGLHTLDVFLLTALAKMGATVATYPMLLVKNRLQAINHTTPPEARYTGVLDAVVQILRREGAAAFYKGMRVKMVQTVLAAALLMSIKEQIFWSTKALIGSAVPVAVPVAVLVSPVEALEAKE